MSTRPRLSQSAPYFAPSSSSSRARPARRSRTPGAPAARRRRRGRRGRPWPEIRRGFQRNQVAQRPRAPIGRGDLVVGPPSAWMRSPTVAREGAVPPSSGRLCVTTPRIRFRMLRTRWLSSAMRSSWRSCAPLRSFSAESVSEDHFEQGDAQRLGGPHLHVRPGKGAPVHDSRHASKLLRGVRRMPFVRGQPLTRIARPCHGPRDLPPK